MKSIKNKISPNMASYEKEAGESLFSQLDSSNKGFIKSQDILDRLHNLGIQSDDPRLDDFKYKLSNEGVKEINSKLFLELIKHDNFMRKTLYQNIVIPNFHTFYKDILNIFKDVSKNTSGKVANYIPQLARVDPDQFAVSICTVDGQRFSIGDSENRFCLQSTCKPINYCLALEELGEDIIHNHIGREPSGKSFNELSLNSKGLPHNPMINAGAIMSSSLIKRDIPIADRFEYVTKTWNRLCGNRRVHFNNSVYLSERQTADRNFALAYFMRENNSFMPNTNITETLEFYFQCCSIESCTDDLSIAAATFANSGYNPLTNEKIFGDNTVRNCISLMSSCGMYDFSGEFAFKMGIPAKSGVSGAMMVVIPNVMGISIWSPRLDILGNSVRGVEFCDRLTTTFNFHVYDSLIEQTTKKDPRRRKFESKIFNLVNLIYAADNGDLKEIYRLEAEGLDLNSSDYDGRTALHLAASSNQIKVVEYLIRREINLEPIDRWGNTPLKDAIREGYEEIVFILEKAKQDRDKKNKSKVELS